MFASKTTKPQPTPYHLTDSVHNGQCYISTEGNDRGGVALAQDEPTAAFLVAAANGFAALMDTLQHLVNDLDLNHPGIKLPAPLEHRLREQLKQAAAGFDPVVPEFEAWYQGITVEGDMRTNMLRAYVAGVANQAVARAQMADAEFPQVHLRSHQSQEALALFCNFKHLDGEWGAMLRAIGHSARCGFVNGFKDGKECASDNDATEELVGKLTAQVAAGQLAQTEFNRAIEFAQKQGMEIDVFLKLWQHGDWDILEKEFGYTKPVLPSVEDLTATAPAVQMVMLTPDQVKEIGESWDGCKYDAPGEEIDIGASIRRQIAQADKANRA